MRQYSSKSSRHIVLFKKTKISGALAANTLRKLQVPGQDRDAFGVNRAKIRVLKKRNEVGL